MLMLTPTAVEAVREITTGEGAPPEAGLRITTPDDASSFQLSLAAAPADGEEVLTTQGARIFLDHQSAVFFDDKILDAGLDATGNATFVVGPQDTGGAPQTNGA
ncbi:hypothetical protein GPX89_08625 [Nocardia sp. ET3-3]|uniref:Fe-S cluster assembly iron-binding protein IscA n=1 Tax=Nocardia terrae TaxID=2675851 RepID=A0A7K1UT43_9NOCA|nr:hypothetical protein [Nocardia terrae]MVU77309.1 hypothetical protein [Nocardia terrae]